MTVDGWIPILHEKKKDFFFLGGREGRVLLVVPQEISKAVPMIGVGVSRNPVRVRLGPNYWSQGHEDNEMQHWCWEIEREKKRNGDLMQGMKMHG